MDLIFFLQGMIFWAVVGACLTAFIYAVGSYRARSLGVKIMPWHHLLFIVVGGCELMYSIQTLLREYGFTGQETKNAFLIIKSLMIISIFAYNFLYQNNKK